LPLSGRPINTQGDRLISIDQQIGWRYPEMGTVAAMYLAARVMRPAARRVDFYDEGGIRASAAAALQRTSPMKDDDKYPRRFP